MVTKYQVSFIRNVFLVSSIHPKKQTKQFDLSHSSKVEFFLRLLGELKIPKIHF